MTHKELKQIIYLKSEIITLSLRMKRSVQKSKDFIGDYGYDYSSGQKNVITISGFPLPDEETRDKINQRVAELKALVVAAEKFISEIPDARIRVILSLRYLEGFTWHDIAKKIYKNMTADAVRKCTMRWFAENKK